MEFLKDTFIANDCPVKVVGRVFKNYVPRKYSPMMENKKQDEQADFGKVLTLPFIKDFHRELEEN